MTSIQFCYWLRGYFDLSSSEELDVYQVNTIKQHLDLVFNEKISDPPNDSVDVDRNLRIIKRVSNRFEELNPGYRIYINKGFDPNNPDENFQLMKGNKWMSSNDGFNWYRGFRTI